MNDRVVIKCLACDVDIVSPMATLVKTMHRHRHTAAHQAYVQGVEATGEVGNHDG